MNQEPVKLLIGEDDTTVALQMQNELTKLGYWVAMKAAKPQVIVDLARDLRPDVIVLDLNLQGDSHGIEVSRTIHEVARIPIVFLTEFARDVVENEHALPRPYRYVIKPYSLHLLDRAIQELLETTRTHNSI
jgi:DNA-binding response OmpR family regulator